MQRKFKMFNLLSERCGVDIDAVVLDHNEEELEKLKDYLDKEAERLKEYEETEEEEVMTKTRGFEVVVDHHRKHQGEIKKPIRADIGSCAYDFFSPVDITIKPNEQVLIFSDIKAYMQQDEVLLLNVRSSQGKVRIQFANTQGWIDSTYYNNQDNDGNCGLYLRNEGTEDYVIRKGDRIAQGMFIKYLTTDDDNPTNTFRTGGFGSSGK